MRSPRRTLAAATLSLEAFVVFFAGLVAKDTSSLSTGAALGLFAGLALACLLVAGLLRRRWGYAAGWVLQAAGDQPAGSGCRRCSSSGCSSP